jgi:hypothetical protein
MTTRLSFDEPERPLHTPKNLNNHQKQLAIVGLLVFTLCATAFGSAQELARSLALFTLPSNSQRNNLPHEIYPGCRELPSGEEGLEVGGAEGRRNRRM